jgi:ribosomal protein S18 acetylase RimI-like enzyme
LPISFGKSIRALRWAVAGGEDGPVTGSEDSRADSATMPAEPVERERARIRPYRPADLDALYRICLQTDDDGKDATSLYRDPRLPGHLYAAPYGVLEPSLAFVAEDSAGVGGYIVGALDSQAFEERRERQWWPGLRRRYPQPLPETPAQRWTPDQRMAYRIHHPWRAPADLAERYPSHLHINLVPRLQARGYGKSLIKTMIEELCAQGSGGLHLHVNPGNQRAASFYRHIGFAELPATDAHLFGMDLRGMSARHLAGGTHSTATGSGYPRTSGSI